MAARKTYKFLQSAPPDDDKRRTSGGNRLTQRYNASPASRSGGRVLEPADNSIPAQQRKQESLKAGRRTRSTSVELGTSKLPARVQQSRAEWFPEGGTSLESSLESNLGAIYDELSGQYRERQQEQAAIANEYYSGDLPAPPEIGGWAGVAKDVFDVASTVPGVPSAETFAGSPVGRMMDVASRPSYALWEGIKKGIQYDPENGGRWKDLMGEGPITDIAQFTEDVTGGMAQGLMGREKTGPGNVYEEFKELPDLEISASLRSFESEHPQIEQRIAQSVGLAGEIFDPAPTVGLGSANVFKKGAQELAGGAKQVTAATTRDITAATAAKVAGDYFDDIYDPRYGGQVNPIPRQDFIDHAVTNALDKVSASELPIRGGGARGSRYRVMNGRLWGHTVAQSVINSTREVVLKKFNRNTEIFWRKNGTTAPLSDTAVSNMMAQDPDFAQYIDDIENRMVNAGDIPANAPLNVLLVQLGTKSRKYGERFEQAIRDAYDADLQQVGIDAFAMTRNASYRTLGLRFGNKVIPVRATGRAYNGVAQRIQYGKADPSADIKPARFENISYEKMFPSILSLRAQRARSIGSASFKAFKRDFQKIARKYTKEQARVIHDAIENNVDLSGDAFLQAGKEAVMKAYADMWRNEIAAGTRPKGEVMAPNYVFIYNRKGKIKERTDFKKNRKDNIHAGLSNAGNYNMARAKNMGLKPVDNAFEAVMHRYLKSQRDITRSLYLTDLIENYGFRTHKIGDIATTQRQITKIKYDQLPQHLRSEVDHHGGAYYLPNAHMQTSDNFNRLSSWNSAEMGEFTREWNKVVNFWKFWQTIPNPGFHVTNWVGDTFMGMMDGVKATEYFNLMRKVMASKAGRPATYRIAPGFDMTVSALWTMYQKDAAGGYYHIDVGNYVKPSTKNIVGRVGRGTRDIAVDLSEMREDFGRFAHYIHAFKEEARVAYKNGERSNFKLMQTARDSALWRVNHYRFDYSALTLWERQMRTIGVPFYTFTRKVIPILLESMYQNPKYITSVNRFMLQHDDSAAEGFNNWDVPEYLRMGGGGFLNNENEPLFASLSALPLGNLNTLQPGGTWDPRKPEFWYGLGDVAAKNTGPLIQAPFEAATGREIFTGQQVDPSSFDYMINKLPLAEDIRTEGNQIPGLNKLIPGQNEEFDPQALLYNRLFGAGQQIRPVTQGQQEQAHNQWIDELIEDPMSQINRDQDLYTVSTSNVPSPNGQMKFRVLDRQQDNELIREFNTAQEAMNWVKNNLPRNYRKPETFISPGLNETGQPRMVTRGG